MKLTSAKQIGKREGYPGYTTIRKCSQRKARPDFFHWDKKILCVDEDSPTWLTYLAQWRDKKLPNGGRPEKSPYDPRCNTLKKSVLHQPEPPQDSNEPPALSLKDVKLKANIRKINLASDISEMKLKRQQKILIERDLSEFLYFGYMDRMNVDLLKIAKKITPRIRNLVREQQPDEIIKTINREITVVIREVKKQQKAELEKWLEEHDV